MRLDNYIIDLKLKKDYLQRIDDEEQKGFYQKKKHSEEFQRIEEINKKLKFLRGIREAMIKNDIHDQTRRKR